MKLRTRIALAIKVFMGIPFEKVVEPFSIESTRLKDGYCCDRCQNETEVCISETTASFKLTREDHLHVCKKCAELFLKS